MKKKLQIIGGLASEKVEILPRFRAALKGLSAFDHVLALVIANGRLEVRTLRLRSVDERTGVLEIADGGDEAPLVDLKPYLPCEDFVGDEIDGQTRGGAPLAVPTADGFELSVVGAVDKREGRTFLQFETALPEELGSIIRVVWFFSRFEDKRYRKTLLCTPPYATKGKIGVFASRSPVRPNPLALTTVRVLAVDAVARRVEISSIEAFDGTPLLGVVGYTPTVDAVGDARVADWAKDWPKRVAFGAEVSEKEAAERLAAELDAKVGVFPEPVGGDEGRKPSNIRPQAIEVRGARANNLKGIGVTIPYGKITALVGVSGSGKSSLAIDTVYAECRRRMEFLTDGAEEQPPVEIEEMTGAIPVVRIAQKELRANARSTVGTFTGLVRHLRVLYARFGRREWRDEHAVEMLLTPTTFCELDEDARCPLCRGTGIRFVADEQKVIVDPEKSILDGASPFLGRLRAFMLRPNANWMKGQIFALASAMKVDLEKPWRELPSAFREKILHGDSSLALPYLGGRRSVEGLLPVIERLAEENRRRSIALAFLSESQCPACRGERLGLEGRLVTLMGVRYPLAASMTFDALARFVTALESSLDAQSEASVRTHIEAILSTCRAARRLGIGQLELSRRTSAMSGGEAQRLKLLTAFSHHLSGILYVFDEPSKRIGRTEYGAVSGMMRELVADGNTILMVEHNPEMISIADKVVEIGPGAGEAGGHVIASGTYGEMLANPATLLSRYAANSPAPRRMARAKGRGVFAVRHVTCHNLKDVSVEFERGAFTCLTGASGAGKSSLLYGGVLPQAEESGAFSRVVSVESKSSVVSPRSTVATYSGMMDELRRAGVSDSLRLSVAEAERYFAERAPKVARICARLSGNGLGYLRLDQPTARLSGGETARLGILAQLGSSRRGNALYLLDEPTCGLHYSDIDRLLALVFDLVDCGNTVIAIEHNARFLAAADRVITFSPAAEGK